MYGLNSDFQKRDVAIYEMIGAMCRWQHRLQLKTRGIKQKASNIKGFRHRKLMKIRLQKSDFFA